MLRLQFTKSLWCTNLCVLIQLQALHKSSLEVVLGMFQGILPMTSILG